MGEIHRFFGVVLGSSKSFSKGACSGQSGDKGGREGGDGGQPCNCPPTYCPFDLCRVSAIAL